MNHDYGGDNIFTREIDVTYINDSGVAQQARFSMYVAYDLEHLEGTKWIRGLYDDNSNEVKAMRAAQVLGSE